MEEGGLANYIPYTEFMLSIAQIFELLAAITILIGLVWSAALAWRAYKRTNTGSVAYKTMRQSFGGAILLGLEILVAGDLVRTVAVYPTIENVGVLAIIVLIRTVLSFSLEIEIEGVPPWRRAMVSGATVMKQAAKNAKGENDG
ncbi:DUF1622 domain-containing protein [bacterium]|jgi:uncharacterized membrane protein|nr:DUF1622 domain-containing protein [bacterium]